jgi:hypothetical protein
LTAAASLKIHDTSPHSIDLPLTGAPGIECRDGSDYTIVFTFSNTLDSVGDASSTCGTASGVIDGSDAHKYNVTLTGVGGCNAQYITITLTNVNDTLGNNVGSVSVTMGLLIGDTTSDRSVNSADIGQTKSQSGHAVTSSNFREDVTADGSINSADIGLVKSKSGTALPSLP